MIQQNLQYLLDHPDITFTQPSADHYICVQDAATGEQLAWVRTYDRAAIENAIQRAEQAQAVWKQQTALQKLIYCGTGTA